MKKEKVEIPRFTLIGLTARTNNKNEMNPELSKIASLAAYYWSNQIANEFKHRINPGITYAVYTEFENDENGDYTYFIGEEIKSIEDQSFSKFRSLNIPKGTYQKFTTETGKMLDVVIALWQKIWKMTENDFDGKRTYLADFEVYDQRASDPSNTTIDIYIGIK